MKQLLLTLALSGTLSLAAQTFESGGINFRVIDEDQATVSVEKKTPAYTGEIVIPATVSNDGKEYKVIAITQSSSASTSDGAFANCSGLTSVSLPGSLTSIGNYSFNGCTSLTTMTVPKSVKTFGAGAFQNCSGLTSINLPENAESFGINLFSGCSKLTSLVLPEGLTEIPNRVIYGMTALTSLKFPSTVTAIGNDNLRNCPAIKTISVPEGVKTVGNYFIAQCGAAEKVELPSTLTSIGDYSFWNSTAITYLSCAATVPPVATKAFYSWTNVFPNCTLYVPEAAVPAYQAADVWKNFSKIEILLPPPADIDTEFTVDGISYIVKENTDRLAVTVLPLDDPDNEDALNYSGNVNIPSTVKYNGRDYTVTAIGVGAFYSCKELTSVSLPSTLETIGEFAFARSENLSSVGIIPAGVNVIGTKAFIYTALTSIAVDPENTSFAAEDNVLYALNENGAKTKVIVCAPKTTGAKNIPEGVTEIEYGAFAKCEEVSGITLPSTLVSIGEYAFDSCLRLYTLVVPENVTHIGAQAFYKCTYLSNLTLPSNLETIEEGTFMFCSSLTSLPLPSTVTSIGKYAFEACTGLTEIEIPSSCTFLGDHAFEECRNITSVTIPAGLSYIDDFAFLNCASLTSLTLPEEMEVIGYGAFKDCGKIESISMPESLGELRGYAFGNCTNLTSIVIPDGIDTIADRLFWGCTSLSDIKIPTSVTSIEEFAYDRTPITELILHEGVTFIGEDAFQHCKQLEVISLPSTVEFIDKYAFWDCVSARMFTSLATTPASADKAFSASFPTSTCVLYVPAAAIDLYKEAEGWKRFENISAIPEVGDTFVKDGITYRITGISDGLNTVEVINGENPYSGEITIPDTVNEYFDYSVTAIADEAFAGSTEMTSVTLPKSLETIGHKAFMNCTSLLKITCLGETPAAVEEDAFEGLDPKEIELIVPDNAIDAYKAAPVWKDFFTVDGISDIVNDEISNTPVFDISGRMVGKGKLPTEPGIYIVKGRKINVKP